MSWRPTATPAALKQRATLLRKARAFFEDRGVLEVETPALSAAAVSDPQIESLATQVAGLPGRRCSPCSAWRPHSSAAKSCGVV